MGHSEPAEGDGGSDGALPRAQGSHSQSRESSCGPGTWPLPRPLPQGQDHRPEKPGAGDGHPNFHHVDFHACLPAFQRNWAAGGRPEAAGGAATRPVSHSTGVPVTCEASNANKAAAVP